MSHLTPEDSAFVSRARSAGWVDEARLAWAWERWQGHLRAGGGESFSAHLVSLGLVSPASRLIQPASGDSESSGEGPTLALAASAEQPQVPGYRLGARLGEGGLGQVFEADDLGLRRQVAVKIGALHAAEVFAEEGRITGALEHPNIVPIHDCGRCADGRPFLALKRVRGETLAEHIAAGLGEDGRWSQPIAWLVKVCDAIAYAHSEGVIHRDLKPENIMIGGFGEVLVMDWGLARVRGRSLEAPSMLRRAAQATIVDQHFAGTPGFMAPEQAIGEKGEIGPRTDVFGLGGILYAILTGLAPYEVPEEGDAALVAVRASEAILAPELRAPGRPIPRPLASLAMAALAAEPGERVPSAEAFAADLRAWLAGRAVSTHRESAGELLLRLLRARPLVSAAAFASALVLTVTAAFATLQIRAGASQARQAAAAARDATAQARGEQERAGAALATLEAATAARRQAEAARLAALEFQNALDDAELSAASATSLGAAELAAFEALRAASTGAERRRVELARLRILILHRRLDLARASLAALRDEDAAAGGEVSTPVLEAELALRLAAFEAVDEGLSRVIQEHARRLPDGPCAAFLAASSARGPERRRLLERCLERDPRFSPALVNLAFSLLRGDDRAAFAEAAEACTRALETSPALALAWGNRGLAYYNLGRDVEAERDLRRAITLDPKLGYAHRVLGLVALRQARWAEARTHLEDALLLDPRDLLSRERLTQLLLERGDPGWEASLKALAAIDPARAEGLRERLESAPERARRELQAALDGSRQDRLRGRLDSALVILRGAVDRGLADAELDAELGRVLAGLGRSDEALAAMQRASQRAPADARLRLELARAQARVGEFEAALATIEAAAPSAADEVLPLLELRATLCADLRRPGELRACDEAISALALEHPARELVAALLAELSGDAASAEAAFARAIAGGCDLALWRRGLWHLAAGRRDAAQRDLAAAARAFPEERVALEAALRGS